MNTLPIVIVGVAAVVVGAVFCAIQLARLVRLDAASRGLKHPRLWGWFALSGNGQSGLLLYLVGRRKYPVLRLSDETRQQMAHYKKGFGVSLGFLLAGAILCVWGGVGLSAF